MSEVNAGGRRDGDEIDLSITVPVHDNEATLDELIDRLVAVLEPTGLRFELIFVDDGSRDGSWSVLQRRAAADNRVRPFAMVRNLGGQAAICAAFDQIRGRWGLCMDADLENLPEDVPRLLAPLREGYDLVCGYRADRQSPWLSRRLPSALLNRYVRRVTGTKVRDLGCGMRAFESRIVRDLAREGEARRLLTPVFLRRARRIAEVPIRHAPRRGPGGHSFLSLLGIAVDYYLLTARRPFLRCGLVSLLLLLAAAAVAGAAQPWLALVLASTGLLGAGLSLLGEHYQRIYHLVQRTPFYSLRDEAPRPRRDGAGV